tara:strand:+ start:440 stop:973 length:534 start_codon:yes stop_codon:yes gene_type:complete
MLSLYNSLGFDGGSVSKENRLLVIGNNVRGRFPEYSNTPSLRPLRSDDPIIDQSRSDINQDGLVAAEDLTILLGSFNLAVKDVSNERADINEDGIIDGADLTILLSNWGQEFDVPDDNDEEEEEEEENDGEDSGGGNPNDPPIVGVVQTINGLVYPTSRVNVSSSPALPAWIKERNV